MLQTVPTAFLASRIFGLEEFRYQIWEQGRNNGTPIWVSEIETQKEMEGKTLDEVQVACLKHVRTIQKFICVLDGSFGKTWNPGQVSILELEIATAAFSGRDIWVYLLGSFDSPDPRILGVLKAIRISCPDARIKQVATSAELCSEIISSIEHDSGRSEGLAVGPLVQNIASKRTPLFNFKLNLKDVQFLNSQFVPLFNRMPDEDIVEDLITQAAQEEVVPDKLARLWVAVRHLSSAPYNDRGFERFLPLWEKVLTLWSSSSAWYALHGHFYMGRLAAVNTLSVIRARMPDSMKRTMGPQPIFANNGAAASEYYSMAKVVPSWQFKYFLLRKALWNCNMAIQDPTTPDPSGLLDIRGHVKLAMLKPLGAISDLKLALTIRQRTGQDLGRIGESQVHLGMAYATCRMNQKAERLLEQGVSNLETTDRYPFIVQGLRHLGAFYGKIGRRTEGIEVLRKAHLLASSREIQGQLSQVNAALKKWGV